MAATEIQSLKVPFQVSEDNGTTWITIVCINEHTAPLTTDTTDTNTQCGIFTGVGPVKAAPTFNAVASTTPEAGQASVKQITNWAANQTRLKYRLQDPIVDGSDGSAGSLLYLSGSGIISSLTMTFTVGDVAKFNGTLSLQGTISTTPGT